MIRESNQVEAERVLAEAMETEPPAVGVELEQLLGKWLTISSLHLPGQSHPLRFPFLKWAIQGRAVDVIEFLAESDQAEADVIADELERIAALPYPARNERAQKDAYDMWAWLKEELYGSLEE